MKTFDREADGAVGLQPENAALEPIHVGHVRVLGKVVGVRSFDERRRHRSQDARPGAARARGRRASAPLAAASSSCASAAPSPPRVSSPLARPAPDPEASSLRTACPRRSVVVWPRRQPRWPEGREMTVQGGAAAALAVRGKSGHRRAGRRGSPGGESRRESGTEQKTAVERRKGRKGRQKPTSDRGDTVGSLIPRPGARRSRSR